MLEFSNIGLQTCGRLRSQIFRVLGNKLIERDRVPRSCLKWPRVTIVTDPLQIGGTAEHASARGRSIGEVLGCRTATARAVRFQRRHRMQRISVKGTRNETGRYQQNTGYDQKVCKRERHSGNNIEEREQPRLLRDVADQRSARKAVLRYLKMSGSKPV
jgi:hypothetical protein